MTRTFTSTALPPRERGYEFGAALAGPVRSTVDSYLELFASRGGTPELVDSLGAAALSQVDGWAPELGAEIRGIAAGAGLPAVRVAAINARTEILAHLGIVAAECSTVVSPGLAVQNWDWYATMADNWLQWTIPFPDGRRVTTVTEYGLVGKIGVSSAGVGTLFNILHHRRDGAGMGVPVHVVARRILDRAGSVGDGLALCASVPSYSASTSITIVDGAGAVAAEVWPGGVGQVPPDASGLLVRTNHFLSAPARDGDTWTAHGEDTLVRHDELRRRLTATATVAEAFAVLSDDASGLCCHPGPGGDHATLATVVLDLPGRTLRVSSGSPCRALAGPGLVGPGRSGAGTG